MSQVEKVGLWQKIQAYLRVGYKKKGTSAFATMIATYDFFGVPTQVLANYCITKVTNY
jgi:hypothetical protein